MPNIRTSIRFPQWDNRFVTFGYPESRLLEARGLLGPKKRKSDASSHGNENNVALSELMTLSRADQGATAASPNAEGDVQSVCANAKPAFLADGVASRSVKQKDAAAPTTNTAPENGQGGAASRQRVNHEERWNAMFQKLVEFHRSHHHTNVPCYKENKRLSLWVESQRRAYRHNKLAPEREAYLNGLGFAWRKPTKETKQAIWELRLSELEGFYRTFGHIDVPFHCKEFPKLGFWAAWQRDLYRKGTLPTDRVAALNKVSFDWHQFGSSKKRAEQETWDKRFDQLMDFRQRFGHTCVPQRYRENPSLGLWVRHVRKRHRKNELSQEFVERLAEVGFVFFPNVGRQKYTALKKEAG